MICANCGQTLSSEAAEAGVCNHCLGPATAEVEVATDQPTGPVLPPEAQAHLETILAEVDPDPDPTDLTTEPAEIQQAAAGGAPAAGPGSFLGRALHITQALRSRERAVLVDALVKAGVQAITEPETRFRLHFQGRSSPMICSLTDEEYLSLLTSWELGQPTWTFSPLPGYGSRLNPTVYANTRTISLRHLVEVERVTAVSTSPFR